MSLPKGHLCGADTKNGKSWCPASWLDKTLAMLDNALVQSMQAGCWAPTACSVKTTYALKAPLGLVGSNFAAQIWKSNTNVALSKHFAVAC
jgi:hypothetical protein